MDSPLADVFYITPFMDVTRNTTLTEVSDEFMNTSMTTHYTGCLMIVAGVVIVVTIFQFFMGKLVAGETNIIFDAERKTELQCLRTFERIRRTFPFFAVLDIFIRPICFSYGEDPADRRYVNLAKRREVMNKSARESLPEFAHLPRLVCWILALVLIVLGVCTVFSSYIELESRPSWTPALDKWLCQANLKLDSGKRTPFDPCLTPDCRDIENSPFSRMCSAEEEIGTALEGERLEQLRVKLEADVQNEESDSVYYQFLLVFASLEFFVAGALLILHPENIIRVNRPDLKFVFLLRSQVFYTVMFMCALFYLTTSYNFHVFFFHHIETQTCLGRQEKEYFLRHFKSPPVTTGLERSMGYNEVALDNGFAGILGGSGLN